MEKVGITDSCGFMYHSGITGDLSHLEYDAMLTGKWLQTFQRSFLIIIIIIFIYCNWVVTRWQWLFYMYTKHEICYY